MRLSAQKPKPGEGALHHSTPANRIGRIDDEKQAANDDFATGDRWWRRLEATDLQPCIDGFKPVSGVGIARVSFSEITRYSRISSVWKANQVEISGTDEFPILVALVGSCEQL